MLTSVVRHHRRYFSDTTPPPNSSAADSDSDKEGSKQPLYDGGTEKKDELYLKLAQENKELKEKVLRSLAEEENVRRIAKRDVDNARLYANTSFAKAMLEVADDLDRALSSVPLDKKGGESQDKDHPTSSSASSSSLSSLIKGIEMTDRNLHKIFTKFGIVKFGAPEEAFDPNFHDALYEVPDSTKPTGTIAQVVKVGYKLQDRVIRAAQVGTTVNTP